MDPKHPTLERLEDQIGWYDRKSMENQRSYKRLKVATITAAALVPIVANLGVPGAGPTAGLLGVLIVVMEGLQQLNQYQQLWISYRSTAETLKHEKYLFLGRAHPYHVAEEELIPLLAERVESLVSQEHAKWVSAREQSAQPKR